jgi:DNA-binding transcriptional regulator YhcF (GntR family)
MIQCLTMIDPVTAEQVFDAAIRIQVCEKKYLEVDFFPDQVRVHLPPKRVLARSCSVPMSKMTAILSEMERDNLIGTAQRGGMWVAPPGNRIIAGLLERKYRNEAEAVLGPVVLKRILRQL